MTRLNFANRASKGPKLGAIIAKRLQSFVSKQAKSHIELEAPGQALTDEGILSIRDALVEILRSGSSLKILNLSGNDLTAISLGSLAPVIALAAPTLRSINLSNNKISVTTEEEAWAWERFWRSFYYVSQVEIVDLSDNEIGGHGLPWEIFLRVYGAQSSKLHNPSNRKDSLVSQENGLRGQVSCIRFDRTALGNLGALHLSWVIIDHTKRLSHLPDYSCAVNLTDDTPADESKDLQPGIKWSTHQTGPRGTHMQADGRQLLTLCEAEGRSEEATGKAQLIRSVRMRLQVAQITQGVHGNQLWSTALKLNRFCKAWQKNCSLGQTVTEDKRFRMNVGNIFTAPHHVWTRILYWTRWAQENDGPDAEGEPVRMYPMMGILNYTQEERIADVGQQDFELKKHRAVHAKGTAREHQVWMWLEKVGCLTYEWAGDEVLLEA